MNNHRVEKPKHRGRLRKYLGREYFILKRRWQWAFGDDWYAKKEAHTSFEYSIMQHRSFLLRPLKDVDMYLQHNKVTNLKLAIAHLDKVVIQPGQIIG